MKRWSIELDKGNLRCLVKYAAGRVLLHVLAESTLFLTLSGRRDRDHSKERAKDGQERSRSSHVRRCSAPDGEVENAAHHNELCREAQARL